MFVAAAVCPSPPLLVPEVASGAAPELEGLREACDRALRTVLDARPDLLCVVGPGPEHRVFPQGTQGGFRSFGVDLRVRLGDGRPGDAEPEGSLPASLAVGAWLLERAGWHGPVRGLAVPDYLEQPLCAENGAQLAESAERVGLLVLGEGSARRTVKSPGYHDERAEGFDAAAAKALASGEVRGLDAELAFELMATGRAPWEVLAGARGGQPVRAELLYEDAPYGVGYFVASWSR